MFYYVYLVYILKCVYVNDKGEEGERGGREWGGDKDVEEMGIFCPYNFL